MYDRLKIKILTQCNSKNVPIFLVFWGGGGGGGHNND